MRPVRLRHRSPRTHCDYLSGLFFSGPVRPENFRLWRLPVQALFILFGGALLWRRTSRKSVRPPLPLTYRLRTERTFSWSLLRPNRNGFMSHGPLMDVSRR